MVRRHVILAVVAIALAHGCSQPLEVHEAPVIHTRLRNLASLCGTYAARNKKRPASIEELKGWVKRMSQAERNDLRIEDPESAFISPRDNQPFVLLRATTPRDILAYEKTGEGGKHYVVTATGGVIELDEAELKRRVPIAK